MYRCNLRSLSVVLAAIRLEELRVGFSQISESKRTLGFEELLLPQTAIITIILLVFKIWVAKGTQYAQINVIRYQIVIYGHTFSIRVHLTLCCCSM